MQLHSLFILCFVRETDVICHFVLMRKKIRLLMVFLKSFKKRHLFILLSLSLAHAVRGGIAGQGRGLLSGPISTPSQLRLLSDMSLDPIKYFNP